MLYLYTGTDREKARGAMNKTLAREAKGAGVVRITDANSVADLRTALRGSGMFGEKKIVALDGVFANAEMKNVALDALPRMKASDEPFFILEEKPDAETRRTLEKHAETSERFDAKKEKDKGEIFALAHALRRADKKALWVGYQSALARDEAPEAIHGVLFWGAKDMFLKSSGAARERAGRLVAELAELPHEARRRGFELEYALERYILSVRPAASKDRHSLDTHVNKC
ncbi:hypothetical protein A3C21_01110 [Candidatus Kaiserbacteria bacterium RIFCSPHIGHO2_02_FULL_59_21]|uniref:DNA polymerase III delta N-terminal domain-containing protein n=2 Tax=Candidatus Kaiseribacteriota TaxID=1752734 RepID=A0A0G1YS34_9BACT|nr:MAG: hypothetical protein UY98_C0033G0002 [Candidatus Kaiserbacteria bacterium GW2011_GWA2_58_9]OGG61808.1 MAG: hypothetical protein A2766_02105 [Candidatus Kaiserbacteria bacterium RIFCSPHIGHO2_01_FULL_58_22]OGG66955.1 MAG: hypothetical protein A3C21_01110 [Candidatus Kaiserbacteria bacterium RIFCSPHIGHO2_02_FULL_59_21]OGG80350.1 MAG: hypothetical protein A2952_02285 [Candidatus Kaiserbacteria bacterium RIFCSPLOWO2_01_FULL_59_34]OGG85663.1 MAG: hypothetical protein A3I47_00485 [Candidatus K